MTTTVLEKSQSNGNSVWTPKRRLLETLAGRMPDRVPVTPDFSNMIPCRLTGKPFWDIYLYKNPPRWLAYINCVKHFGIDGFLDGLPVSLDAPAPSPYDEKFIVFRDDERIITRRSYVERGQRRWEALCTVYYRDNPPTSDVPIEKIGLPAVPDRYEPVEGVREWPTGEALLRLAKETMGDHGLIGVSVASSLALKNEQEIYEYYDHPELHEQWAAERIEAVDRRFDALMRWETKPDFICVGASGTLVFQTMRIFKQLAFPAVRHAIERASLAGLPTHIHSCGPEANLVRYMADNTALSVIDPLEIPPMGDCDLKQLKKDVGSRITLKGNLHTTEVMLRGSPDDVLRESRKCIDDAADGGRFILSTGDQCGRDTPDENIFAMINAVNDYGKY